VTHDQAEAFAMAQRLAVMDNGRSRRRARRATSMRGRRTRSSRASSAPPTCCAAASRRAAGRARRCARRRTGDRDRERHCGRRGRADPAAERLTILTAPADGAIVGKVVSSVFQGDSVEYGIDIGASALLRAIARPDRDLAPVRRSGSGRTIPAPSCSGRIGQTASRASRETISRTLGRLIIRTVDDLRAGNGDNPEDRTNADITLLSRLAVASVSAIARRGHGQPSIRSQGRSDMDASARSPGRPQRKSDHAGRHDRAIPRAGIAAAAFCMQLAFGRSTAGACFSIRCASSSAPPSRKRT
jgi:hypothetical protein